MERGGHISYILLPRSIREVRRDLHRLGQWRAELEGMRSGAGCGCLHVESRTLRATLLPYTITATDQIKGYSWQLHGNILWLFFHLRLLLGMK